MPLHWVTSVGSPASAETSVGSPASGEAACASSSAPSAAGRRCLVRSTMGDARGTEGWADFELSPLFGSGLDCGLWIRMTLGEAGPEPAGETLANGGPRLVAGALGEPASLSPASMVSPARNAAAWKAEYGSTSPAPSGSSPSPAPVAAGPVSSSAGKSSSGNSSNSTCLGAWGPEHYCTARDLADYGREGRGSQRKPKEAKGS